MPYSSSRSNSCFGLIDWSKVKIDWDNIQNKPDCFDPCDHEHSHSHTWGEITGKPECFPACDDGKTISVDWNDITNKPDCFPPCGDGGGGGGSVSWGDITGKPDCFPPCGDGGGGDGGGGTNCDEVQGCLEGWEPPDDGCVRLPRTWMNSLTLKSDGTGNRPTIAMGVQNGGDLQGWYIGLAAGPKQRRFRVRGNNNWDHSLGCGGRPREEDDNSDVVVFQAGEDINDITAGKRFFKNKCIPVKDVSEPGKQLAYQNPTGTGRVFFWETARHSNSDVVFAADEVDIQNFNFEAIVSTLGGVKEQTTAGAINFSRSKPSRQQDGKALPHPSVMLDPVELAAINPILANWEWTDDSYEIIRDENGEDVGTRLIDNPTAEPTSASKEALIAVLMKTVKELSERVATLENRVTSA